MGPDRVQVELLLHVGEIHAVGRQLCICRTHQMMLAVAVTIRHPSNSSCCCQSIGKVRSVRVLYGVVML